MAGEFDFIDWIRAQTPAHPRIVIPPGDDLAALKWDANDLVLAGADQVLDGVHFNSAVHSPRDIGRKAMNRNLSDCAAMACLPAAAIATVALPKGTSIDYAKELYLGMKEAGDKFDCPIVGGDTGSWDGRLAVKHKHHWKKLGRFTHPPQLAQAGDVIGVTGSLGGSILGRHMTFQPRVHEAIALCEVFDIHAMIDLSDGLSRDLRHICRESGCGAVINAETIPIHDDGIEMRRDGRSPLAHALHDGEDYELLVVGIPRLRNGAIPVQQGKLIASVQQANVDVDLTYIGVISQPPEIVLKHSDGRREPLEPKAWEHKF